jgi:hypothetical protein
VIINSLQIFCESFLTEADHLVHCEKHAKWFCVLFI